MLKIFFVFIFSFCFNESFANENLQKSRLFIEQLGVEMLDVIAPENISDKDRESNFKKLYLKAFDNKYISKFVLGRYWKKLDDETRLEFFDTFEKYLVKSYAPKFKGWKGKFKTTNSVFEKNMYIVEMKLVSQNISSLTLDWRLYLNQKKKFKILDVNIDGVSMLVTQRAEFASVIKNNPDGVKGLIKQMIKKLSS